MKISPEEYYFDEVMNEGTITMNAYNTTHKYCVCITTGPYNSVAKNFSGKFEVCFLEIKNNEYETVKVKFDPVLFSSIYNIAKSVGLKMMRNKAETIIDNSKVIM